MRSMPSPNVMASVRMSGSGGSKGDTVCHFDAPGVEGSYGPDGSSYLNHTTQVKCLTSLILTRPLIFDSEEQSALPSAIGLQSLEVERRYSGSYPPPERCQSLCNLPKMKDTQLPATRWQARSAFAETQLQNTSLVCYPTSQSPPPTETLHPNNNEAAPIQSPLGPPRVSGDTATGKTTNATSKMRALYEAGAIVVRHSDALDYTKWST
jgi:hypothetical protein